MFDHATASGDAPCSHRIAIIGTGFAGLGMAIRLKQAGIDDFVVFEKADDVGGTWRDNTYPGAACDVPSHLYSFSFALNPGWSRSYSPQPELWAYLRRCAREFGVLEHIGFNHEVLEAAWDEQEDLWRIQTSQGLHTAKVLIAGMGGLSEPAIPPLPGLDSFGGKVFHSATWDHSFDLTGKKVAVIGTGASAIQFVPQIAPRVAQLHLFQRTPPWIAPRLDRPLTAVEKQLFRHLPLVQRLVRGGIFWSRELMALPLTVEARLAKAVELLARLQLRTQVPDAELRAKLTPDYTIGCKRILISNDYYPALSRPNAEVVTTGISEIRPDGIVDREGVERQVDAIIFGTGFQVTDASAFKRLRGRGGTLLADRWQEQGRQAYLGTTIAGYPNLFMLVGPNTGTGHISQVFMIESQIGYIMDALRYMDAHDIDAIEVIPEVQEEFTAQLQTRMGRTVWILGGCASWYLDAFGRNTTLWPSFASLFWLRTRRFGPSRYRLQARARQPELIAS